MLDIALGNGRMDGTHDADSTPIQRSVSEVASETIAPETRALLRLSMLPGLGPRTLTSLLSHFGSPQTALDASPEELRLVDGVGPKLVHTIRTASDHIDEQRVIDWCTQHDCDLMTDEDDAYPSLLREMHDAPPLFFKIGDFQPADQIAVAIVGTRHGTAYGTRMAERLSYGLAKAGVTVVSGLARGIDAVAHEGALSAGGRTIAVLGGGLGQIYPAEHEGLAKAVAADGVVMSEYSPFAKPRGGMFPQRNRIIAALSLATLVIEAPDRSGALITAGHAGELGRDVLALPGPVTSRASRGVNRLIRDGATLVQTVEDVLEALGPLSSSVTDDDGHEIRQPSELTLNAVERSVLELIDASGTLIDQVIAKSGLAAHQVLSTISVLEMRKLIRRLSGQYVARI
ncbi:MAG: DNA-processing protein DprA [Planctomycetota bacterium]